MQARLRGMILMSISNKFGRLLLTTGNKSELAVGYCTIYGDMCGGLAAISDVWKTDVASPGPAFVMAQASMHDENPRPMGVIRNVQAPVFDADVNAQVADAIEKKGAGNLQDLIYSGDTWEV